MGRFIEGGGYKGLTSNARVKGDSTVAVDMIGDSDIVPIWPRANVVQGTPATLNARSEEPLCGIAIVTVSSGMLRSIVLF